MKHIPEPQLSSQPLPRGRFLYRESDDGPRFGLYGKEGEHRLWISRRKPVNPLRAAGPFDPDAAVRALRLANVEIPDGCQLGPWQDGLGFFDVAPLPGHPYWEPVEPASLEPSVSIYGAEDIEDLGDRGCCAAPSYPPRVIWDREDDVDVDREGPPDHRDVALASIYRRYPALRDARLGSLGKMWNAHPKQSLVWAPARALEGGFYIADIELPATSSRRR